MQVCPQFFLDWERASRDTLDVKKAYIDMAGDLVSGVILSQIVYWYLPDKNGESKLRVFKDGHHWLAKTADDWWEECRISAKQARRAIQQLKEMGLIHATVKKFAGNPTTHIRLDWDVFLPKLSEVLSSPFLPKGKKRNIPKGKKESDLWGNSLTEITTETTSEITNKVSQIKRFEESQT